MKRRKRKQNRQIDREWLEALYFGVLTVLCVASLFRGCGAKSAEVSEKKDSSSQMIETVADSNTADTAEDENSEIDLFYTDKGGIHDTTEVNESVRKNTFDPSKFGYVDDVSPNITYYDDNFEALQGIDVSEHQGTINWKKVANAGYSFVFVRVGFRGYGEEGTLNEDTKAVEYLQGAEKAGLQVGAYFYSQAISEEEAREEAEFAAKIIERSGVTLDLPLIYDPEFAPVSNGRANYITREQVCLNTNAFSAAAQQAIHCKVALYANLYWENNLFDAETLNDYEIWYADYQDVPETPYHFTWWQYTETATVPGIKGEMDLNLWIRRMD